MPSRSCTWSKRARPRRSVFSPRGCENRLRRNQPNSRVLGRISAKHCLRAVYMRMGTFWIMSRSISSARPVAWKVRRASSSRPTARGKSNTAVLRSTTRVCTP